MPEGTPPTSRYADESDVVLDASAGKPHTWPTPGSPVGHRAQRACALLPRRTPPDPADPGAHPAHPSPSRGNGPR